MSEAEGGHQAWGLSEYLAVLWRRKWIVLVALIAFPAVAFAVSLRQDSVYQSSADVLLNRTNVGATVLGVPDPSSYQDPRRFSETQAALAQVPEVATRAARIAKLSGVTAVGAPYVVPRGDSDLLTFVVSSRDPDVAVKLATAYAQAFIGYRRELDTAALRQARGELRTRLRQLRAAGATQTALYASISDKEQQLRTFELLQSGHKLVRPAIGAVKIAPKPTRNAMLGLIAGILFGFALAFVLEMLDKRVRSEAEIERRLGLPLLGRIPDPPRFVRDKTLVMLADPRSGHAEPFRRLRTNLEFVNADRQARTILVTSAVAGEGKSTTAGNLAVAAAYAGRHVALVDLDLRRPTLHDLFGVPQRPGATDVARGTVGLEDALRPVRLLPAEEAITSTNGRGGAAGKLEFLAVGAPPPNPGEFLGTKGIAEILFALSQRADLVFVDAPPLLAVGDTLPLSAEVDAIVVVTRFGLISRPMLADLARVLQTLPTGKLGFVITGARVEETYGYGEATAYPDLGDRVVELEQPQPPAVRPARWS